MTALDDALDRWSPGLTGQPAYPHLRGQLALRWVDGDAPKTVLDEATWFRGKQSLTDSDDPAAVLAWRISTTAPPSCGDAPLPWLPDVPTVHRELPDARDYLDRLTRRVEDLKERVASEARQEGTSYRTPWQRALPPDIDGRLVGDLAVWRAAHGIPATDPRPTGPPAREPSTATHQARLIRRLTAPEPPFSAPADAASQRLRASRQAAERHRFREGPSTDASVRR